MRKLIFVLSVFCFQIGFSQQVVTNPGRIKLTKVNQSPLFKSAELIQRSPIENQSVDSAVVQFDYSIKNYKLTSQTDCELANHCSNSKQGQHIHLILNNEPYLARYDSSFKENLKNGNYIALSFLSRSYHESLKHKKAYQLIQFNVGNVSQDEKVDLKLPMIFYSRPKGEYTGNDTKKVLLDFYLVNCKLSKSGFKVKVKINDSIFILTEWSAYFIEGLQTGENIIALELLDKNGEIVKSKFAQTTRKIVLK